MFLASGLYPKMIKNLFFKLAPQYCLENESDPEVFEEIKDSERNK